MSDTEYQELVLAWIEARTTVAVAQSCLRTAQEIDTNARNRLSDIERKLEQSVCLANDMPPVRVFRTSPDEAVIVQRTGGAFGNYTDIKLVTIEGV